MTVKRLPIDLHSAERPEGDRAPIEPATQPRLPVHADYSFHGSAGGEVARLKAERDQWKARALKAEEALRRFVSQDAEKRKKKPAEGAIVYDEREWEP